MPFDKEILSAALRDLEQERKQREQELDNRRFEIYHKIPRIRQIDKALRGTAASVMRAALESGEDPSAAIAQLHVQNRSLQEERTQLLLQNGFPRSYLTLRPSCPVCSDLGYVGTTPCECLKARYAQKLTKTLSTILPISDQNFNTFRLDYYSPMPNPLFHVSPYENMKYILQECQDYARDFGKQTKNLLLYGSAGLGKTFLSTCIAGEIASHGFSVAYDTAVSIFSHFEAVKFGSANAQDATQQLRRYRNADLLIIDDLGAEMSTAFTTSAMYELLNERLMTQKAMIINTNLLPTDLERRYSPAIASRILGEFLQFRFFGEDIRMKKRHES